MEARHQLSSPTICSVQWMGDDRSVEQYQIQSSPVSITNPARTIVDCFRYRNKIGIDIAMEGLREGIRQHKSTPDQLWQYAEKARVWTIMRPYVETVVADAA